MLLVLERWASCMPGECSSPELLSSLSICFSFWIHMFPGAEFLGFMPSLQLLGGLPDWLPKCLYYFLLPKCTACEEHFILEHSEHHLASASSGTVFTASLLSFVSIGLTCQSALQLEPLKRVMCVLKQRHSRCFQPRKRHVSPRNSALLPCVEGGSCLACTPSTYRIDHAIMPGAHRCLSLQTALLHLNSHGHQI